MRTRQTESKQLGKGDNALATELTAGGCPRIICARGSRRGRPCRCAVRCDPRATEQRTQHREWLGRRCVERDEGAGVAVAARGSKCEMFQNGTTRKTWQEDMATSGACWTRFGGCQPRSMWAGSAWTVAFIGDLRTYSWIVRFRDWHARECQGRSSCCLKGKRGDVPLRPLQPKGLSVSCSSQSLWMAGFGSTERLRVLLNSDKRLSYPVSVGHARWPQRSLANRLHFGRCSGAPSANLTCVSRVSSVDEALFGDARHFEEQIYDRMMMPRCQIFKGAEDLASIRPSWDPVLFKTPAEVPLADEAGSPMEQYEREGRSDLRKMAEEAAMPDHRR